MLDIALHPNQTFSLPVAEELTLFVYLLEGEGNFDAEGSQPLEKRTAAIFGPGDTLSVKSGPDGVRFMAFYGKALREPVAWAGPVVMNTRAELHQAFTDLENGTFIK